MRAGNLGNECTIQKPVAPDASHPTMPFEWPNSTAAEDEDEVRFRAVANAEAEAAAGSLEAVTKQAKCWVVVEIKDKVSAVCEQAIE